MTSLALKSLWARKVRALGTTFAVVIGVAFVAGSFILTDTIFAAFDEIFSESLKGTSVVVTAKNPVEQENGEVPTVSAACESREEERRCEPGAAGCCGPALRWISMASIRVAAVSRRARGRRPARTAVTIAVRATPGSGGMSRTSAPARSAATAPRPPGYCFSTPSIASESVTTTPRKPRARRSRPVMTLRETDAGRPGSTPHDRRCATAWSIAPVR